MKDEYNTGLATQEGRSGSRHIAILANKGLISNDNKHCDEK